MNRKTLTFILTSICLLFWTSPSIALITEHQKAIDAYKRKDYKTSYNLILPLAEKGFAKAQYNLGVMYGNGKGVAKDYSKAIKWWNDAASQGNGKAQYILGVMYEEGKGVKKNLKKATHWYQLASNQGHAKAQEKLNLLLNKTKKHLQENTASFRKFKSLKEKSSKEINDLQITTASLRLELNQIKSEKTKAIEVIEVINQTNAKTKQELLASSKELKSLKEKKSKEINDLRKITASLRSELNQITSEKTKAIEATNQANAKAKQEQLASSKELKSLEEKSSKEINDLHLTSASLRSELNQIKSASIDSQLASSKELKSLEEKSSKEINDLHLTSASLRSELNQIKSEKTKAIEATNQANAKTKQELLASSKELKILKEKKTKVINDLRITTASLRSELNQIKSEKTKAIEAINQANAKTKQELLASSKELKILKEKKTKVINDLRITTASLRSELNQITSEKTKAIEAINQANAKTKQELLVSSKELKSLKEKSSKEINDLQIATASLRSELNQIKSEKARAIEITNQNNIKKKQEQLVSISDNPSELNAGSISFREDAFSGARYSEDTFTKVGDNTNALDRFHAAINSLGKKEFSLEHQRLLDLADKGTPEAQINLGMMFESGQGVPQDYKEATRWYRLAADRGHIKAQKKLNLLLKKSAEAQINLGLGIMFESGQGVPQDYNEAIRWYRLAADLGLIKAQEKLNLLLNKTKKHLQENTASSNDFKNLKEKSSKEIKDPQTATVSLRSELNQIKSEKGKIIKATSRVNTKAKQEKLASISATPSELNTGSVSFQGDAFNGTRYSAETFLTPLSSKELVSMHLEKWIRAWEKQDMELYLSFYSKEFKGSKERHADWRISRQAALKRHANISIQLQNIQISQSKDTVGINFTQTFKSDEYSDIGVKELVWVKNGSDWKIIKETWIPSKKTT